jgi:hypothetical protein
MRKPARSVVSPRARDVLTTVGIHHQGTAMNDDELPTIDPTQLAAVTGGATSTDTTTQLTAMLQQIMTSIQDIAKNRQSGGGDLMQMLPIMMMMRGRGGGQSAPPPVVYPESVVGPDGLTYNKAG